MRYLLDTGHITILKRSGGTAAMAIVLTQEQQEALDSQQGAPAQVIDPRTKAEYVLIPAADYQKVREWLDDDRLQRAVRAVAARNAARRMEEAP